MQIKICNGMTAKPSEVLQMIEETPDLIFDRVYETLSFEDKANVDQLRHTLIGRCRNMGEKVSKEAILMLGLFCNERMMTNEHK